jgi:argininosuccinate lyase
MPKLWSKADGPGLDALIEEYTVGDDPVLDLRLIPYDIAGSRAHARMLHRIDVLTEEELRKLNEGLDQILKAHAVGEFVIEREDEDCHTAIERYLVARHGDVGKKIHTGRSRNDQVLTAVALWLRASASEAVQELTATVTAFAKFAESHVDVPLPGYTHLQRAMPSTVGRWAGAYASLLQSNAPLLEAAVAMASGSPLGSAAGYGTPEVLGLDRASTAAELGFASVIEPAEAAQPARGKAEAALLFALTQVAQDLGKWAWDVCLYVTSEFGFLRLPPTFTTGSSIMPQKRNPDVLELTRAKAAVVRSALAELQAIAGPLPSGYHRDLQLLKAPLFRGVDTALAMMRVATYVMSALEVDAARCEAAMSPELFATEEAYRLVREGVPFREAYVRVAAKYR